MGGIVPSPKNIVRSAVDPIGGTASTFKDSATGLGLTPPAQDGAPPTPPPSPVLPPSVADASARIRAQRQSADDQQRKRGQKASIFTSDVGVGATPLGRKTLVGS